MENYTIKIYFKTIFCGKIIYFLHRKCFLCGVSCILSALVVCSRQKKGNGLRGIPSIFFGEEGRDSMKPDVTIMDFTGIYEKEHFYGKTRVHWIDCQQIQGTNCYCDEEAETLLRQKIAPFPAEAIHFIDSGNYHYMTKLWTEKLREPFVLVVADHHPDMQPPLF